MAKHRNNARRLRNAVYAMPTHTKEAMLRGILREPRDRRRLRGQARRRRPMLAAHRNGGRTNFGTFARAWDAFTGAGRKPRRASRREVRTSRATSRWPRSARASPPGPRPDRPLADEVRDVQASRRRLLAETNARQGSDISIQDVLAAACTEHALRAEREPAPAGLRRGPVRRARARRGRASRHRALADGS